MDSVDEVTKSRMLVDLVADTSSLETQIRPHRRRDCDRGGKREMSQSKTGRKDYTELQDRELLDETDGLCPLCGRVLIKKKNVRRMPVYHRAHIYPHSPTPEQLEELKDIPKPDDVEDISNIILLCHSCHPEHDFWTTREEYLELYAAKQKCVAKHLAKQESSKIDLQPEIKDILSRLSKLDDSELVELSFEPLAVKKKIETGMLQRKVLENVSLYYETLKSFFQGLDDCRSSTFEKIAIQVKLAFLAQGAQSLFWDQSQIFDSLVSWVQSKTLGSKETCEAVISFFVQDCEVFREISE